MEFNCLTVRDYADRSGDVMYPTADETTRSIRLNESDGSNIKRAFGTQIELAHQGKTKRHRQLWLDQIKAEVVVTDCRVAFAIPKYDKGGGWVGGASALAINAVSKARAAVRSRGSALVGHVRYPWVAVVGHTAYFSMMGNRKHDQLRIGYSFRAQRGGQVDVWVELHLTRDADGHAIAEEILNRAIDHRLAHHNKLSDEDRAELVEMRTAGLSRNVEKGRWTQVSLPATKLTLPETAVYPALDTSSAESGEDSGESEEGGDTDASEETRATFRDSAWAVPDAPTGEPVDIEAGWYADPEQEEEIRYWDGNRWTGYTGEYDRSNDEPAIDDRALESEVPSAPAEEPAGLDEVDESLGRPPVPAPDWYDDPLGERRVRFWDGDRWTEHVAD